MRRIGLYGILFWIFFSLLTCVESYRLNLGTFKRPGPGFFPFSAGLLMMIFSLLALCHSMRKQHGTATEDSGQEPFRWWNIVTILIAIPAYAISLEKIGFLANTFMFITLLLKIVEPQSWKTAVIWGLITAIAANVVFNVIFRAQIPSGILGF